MVSQILLQMERGAILALQKDTKLITPATKGTDSLGFLDKFVSPMDCGQTLSHLVIVS